MLRIEELKKVICAALALGSLSVFWACSSMKPAKTGVTTVTQDWLAKAPLVHKTWSKFLNGYIAELAISAQGNAILVATLPDYDHAGGSDKNYLRYFDGKGRERWKKTLSTQVKAQAISQDGSLAVATTHEDEVIAFNSKGKQLWNVKGTCAPTIIESRKEIVCYHDDDAEPRIAFDVFGWDGTTKLSFPIRNDILALKVSANEAHVAFALTDGIVQVVGADYKLEWSAKLPGEIVDLDVTSEGRAAVLFSSGPGKPAQLAVLENGKLLSQTTLSDRATQIAWSASVRPNHLFSYANAEEGQYFSGIATCSSNSAEKNREGAEALKAPELCAELKEQWHHSIANNAHYTPMMYVSGSKNPYAVIGIEEITPSTRQSRILGVDVGGDVIWNLSVADELKSDEGAYLYVQSFARKAFRLAVATDDRRFGVFDLQATSSRR